MDEFKNTADTRDMYPSDPAIIPDPTYWPFGLAFGITLFFWGFITSAILSVAGIVYMIISLAGWIMELKNEKYSGL